MQYRGGVEDVVAAVDASDNRDDVARRASDFVQRVLVVAYEGRLQQQVFGRIPRQSQLGKRDELGAGVFGGANRIDDSISVAGQVANRGIDLRQRESERLGQRLGHELKYRRGLAFVRLACSSITGV